MGLIISPRFMPHIYYIFMCGIKSSVIFNNL
nr:MAG TPA: hypothetical protein [Caudoviricetes sp.]